MPDISPDIDPMPDVTMPVALSDIPPTRPLEFDFAPDKATLADIATILDATSVTKLRFDGRLEHGDEGAVLLYGQLGATIVQSCVVSLAPVKTRIDTAVHRHFVRNYSLEDTDRQILPEEDENLEPLVDPIDLAGIAIEEIALSLPAYPRAPDAALDQATFAEPGIVPLEDADLKPFAALEALRDKLEPRD